MSETLTRVPAAIAMLLEIATGAVPDGVVVHDGPQVGVELPDRVLVVGMPYGSRTGYSSRVDRQDGFGRRRLTETVTARCLVSVVLPGTDLAAARAGCFEVMAALDVALRDAAVVDGIWDSAELTGDVEWMPVRTSGEGAPAAAVCSALFEIVVTALL